MISLLQNVESQMSVEEILPSMVLQDELQHFKKKALSQFKKQALELGGKCVIQNSYI